MFKKLTIVGPGLLGASLGQAAHGRNLADTIAVWARRAESRLACEDASWCDSVHASLPEAVAEADLVVFATPVNTIIDLIREAGPHLAENALVTDVGSTKSLICRAGFAEVRQPAIFIGSHPMAGSEKTGLENARENLFEGRPCFITPFEDPPSDRVDALARFWKELGMKVQTINPETHDEIVAHISHLPHVLAAVLCSYLQSQSEDWIHFAGQGLKDTTRVAAGSPPLWLSILEQNREEILRSINGFQEELNRLERALHNQNSFGITSILERGKFYRDQLPPGE